MLCLTSKLQPLQTHRLFVDCGDPVPYNAWANNTETTFGAVVEITCDPDRNIRGNSTIICKADGTWTDNPTCNDKGIVELF